MYEVKWVGYEETSLEAEGQLECVPYLNWSQKRDL